MNMFSNFSIKRPSLPAGHLTSTRGLIATGRQKNTGGHDHRTNTGDDRTPSQKTGDQKRQRNQPNHR